jgi:H+/Cl- antiporter ClcA
MGKKILGVILGYLIMFATVFVGLTVAYIVMGADGAFQEGTYTPSMLWNIVMLAVGIVAAVAGGWFCNKFTRSSGAVKSLAIVVPVMGAIMAAFGMLSEKAEQGPRGPEVSSMEAMMNAEPQAWTQIANPIIGVVGVFVGAGLVGGRKSSPAHAEPSGG